MTDEDFEGLGGQDFTACLFPTLPAPGSCELRVVKSSQDSRPRIQTWASWARKIPWRRAWQPTAVFLPGESHGQRSLMGYSPWGHKESDTTERLNSNIPGVTILWTAGQHQYGVCDVTSSLKRWPLNALGLRFPELPPQSTTTWVA